MNNEAYIQYVRFLDYIKTSNKKPPMAAKILWQLSQGFYEATSVEAVKEFADVYYTYITTGVQATSTLGTPILDTVLCNAGGELIDNPAPYTIPTSLILWKPLTGQTAYGVINGQSKPYALETLSYDIPAFVFDQTEYDAVINRVTTPAELATAQFWAAGGGTYTPPGMWVKSAIEQAKTRPDFLTIMYYLTNALANVSIACWAIKYKYNAPRPKTVAPATWNSAIPTPPFPGYVSGHSAFSQAAGDIFSYFNLQPIIIGTTSTRTYTSVQAAVDEAGISRIYGGIHVPCDNVQGKLLGSQVANQSLQLNLRGC